MSPTTHHRPSLVRRIGLACALVAALLLCPLPASGGILWDIGIALGYAALVVAVTLYLYPLRGEGLPHKRLFTLSQHRRIGWIALVLGLLHAAILLVSQPLVGHYLLPSAPLYMLLGLIALIALAILVATGLAARSALRSASIRRTTAGDSHTHKTPGAPSSTPSSARATPPSVSTHAILAAVLLTLTAAHILGSHQLANKPAKIITVCALLVLPLLWTAFRVTQRRQPRKGNSQRGRADTTTGAPTSASTGVPTRPPLPLLPTLLPNCVAAAILFLLPIPTATSHLLQPAATPSLLPLHFPHEKHTTVDCVTCHHNFIDKTGVGSCLECHRSSQPNLTQSAEATFHTFCRTCHTDLAQTTDKHGPTRACSTCHVSSSTAH
jgi:Class III cytochrome C family